MGTLEDWVWIQSLSEDDCRNAIARILSRHYKHEHNIDDCYECSSGDQKNCGLEPWCGECYEAYPCTTITALKG